MSEHRPQNFGVPTAHSEPHLSGRSGWLRAAVMGANDGILSTASLIAGVAAGAADKPIVLLAGFAGLVAGALSMAAGESSSQVSRWLTRQTNEYYSDTHEAEWIDKATVHLLEQQFP